MVKSDIIFDATAFKPESVAPAVAAVNKHLDNIGESTPSWWTYGAAKWRALYRNGETPYPKPEYLEAETTEIPSRDKGGNIPIRIIRPDGDVKIKSVFIYYHGGGWVLLSEDMYDHLLKDIANGASALVVSVGYRLAPEDPWPAGPNDCYDAAEWLADNAEETYGAPLQFMGGDSAGANLAVLSYFHLSRNRPDFKLSGLILYYGCYDLSYLPQTQHYDGNATLSLAAMQRYIEYYTSGKSIEELKNPLISPLYEDLRKHKLPPALFLSGTYDPLYDDTAFMHVKWQMAGGEATTKFYAGAPHGFMNFPANMMQPKVEGLELTLEFINEQTK